MNYKITSITKDGEPRTDGRYPLRIGCIGSIYQLVAGCCFIFAYSKDADGNDKGGYLRTSTVTGIKHEARHIEITTLNSVYKLALIEA